MNTVHSKGCNLPHIGCPRSMDFIVNLFCTKVRHLPLPITTISVSKEMFHT